MGSAKTSTKGINKATAWAASHKVTCWFTSLASTSFKTLPQQQDQREYYDGQEQRAQHLAD